ncbi:MAG TPA: hypothetical protein VGB84_09425, partial [Arachidicoccus sp.]
MIVHWKKAVAFSVITLGFTKAALAQVKPVNIVSSGVPFLQISPDARTGAMGNAGIAGTADAFSTFWNNAK